MCLQLMWMVDVFITEVDSGCALQLWWMCLQLRWMVDVLTAEVDGGCVNS